MTQHDIEQLNAKRADFPATAARLVSQPDPMLLDLDEFLVERKRVGGSFRVRCGKAMLGMGQNFFEVTRRGHCRFWILDFGFAIGSWRKRFRSIQNPQSKIQNGQSSIA